MYIDINQLVVHLHETQDLRFRRWLRRLGLRVNRSILQAPLNMWPSSSYKMDFKYGKKNSSKHTSTDENILYH